jgi:hypothetical protein
MNVIRLDASMFAVPPGIRVESLSPHQLRVNLGDVKTSRSR